MIFHVFFILHPLLPCLYVRQGLSALLSTFYKSDNAWRNFVLPAFHSVTAILRDSPRKGVPERGNTLRNGVHGNMKKQLFLGKYRILLFTLNKTFANSPPCTIPYPESIPLFSPFRKKRQKRKKKHCCTMVKGRCNQTYRTPYYINIVSEASCSPVLKRSEIPEFQDYAMIKKTVLRSEALPFPFPKKSFRKNPTFPTPVLQTSCIY